MKTLRIQRRDAGDGEILMNNSSKLAGGLCLLMLASALFLISCAQNPVPLRDNHPLDPDTVSFQGTAVPGVNKALTLTGRLKKPDGGGPFPAVVLLHGCGGIQPGRDHRWAERLSSWGYVTLQVDSLGPRGISSVCTYSGSDAVDILDARVNDAYEAKKYLAGLPFVDRKRIAVMGWSHGGSTILEVVYKEKENPFRSAIAFYPSCRRRLTGLNAPLLILIGDADDWTPAGKCIGMMPPEKEAFDVTLKVYPGAYHAFDIVGVNSNVWGSKGMHHLQYQPEAEADSLVQVKSFFEKRLK